MRTKQYCRSGSEFTDKSSLSHLVSSAILPEILLSMPNACFATKPPHLSWLLASVLLLIAAADAVGATYTTPHVLNVGDIYELRRDSWSDPPGGGAYAGDVLPKTDATFANMRFRLLAPARVCSAGRPRPRATVLRLRPM
jgi:hypothetical protein